jgi:hypothetical protein
MYISEITYITNTIPLHYIGEMEDTDTMISIQNLPNEMLCAIFLKLDWHTRLNVASLVCKHWFEIISNRKNDLYLYSWRRRLETNGKTEDDLKNFLRRFPKMMDVYLEDQSILPIYCDNNPMLEKVTVSLFDEPIIFMQGKHWLFEVEEEDITDVDDPENLRTIKSTNLQEVIIDPKIGKVSLENIGLKHAARLAIDIDFDLGRDITAWQDGIITNIVNNLENVTEEMEHLKTIQLSFNVKVSDQAEDQLHRILSTLLRVQSKNLFNLWFNMKISFDISYDDANNQPMSFETLPTNDQIKVLELSDWSDWKSSKLATKRLFESMPNVVEVRCDIKTSYHIVELLELISNFSKLCFLELIVSHYNWRSPIEENGNTESFHTAFEIINTKFPLCCRVYWKQIWFDDDNEEIGSFDVITKEVGNLPVMNHYAFLPFIQDTLDQEPDDILAFMDLPAFFMESDVE